MITVSAKFPRKNSLTLGMAIILTCLMGVREARAQGNDLIDAAVKGDLATVNALLAKGVDVNARGDKGYTALIWATENGHNEVVQALLAHNADVNAKPDDGNTALIWAA